MTVRANRELQHRECERPSERSTRHLEIALPAGVTYQAGDHLGIVPRNGLDQIRRVLLRFKLDAGLYLTITPHTNASTHLPVNEPVPLLDVLANRVELQDVATRAQLATLAEHAPGCRRAGRAAGARRGRRRQSGSLPRAGARAAQVASRPARRVSVLRAAVRGVSRSAPAAAAALLLDLVVPARVGG